MRIAFLCAAVLALAGCNQEAVANLGKCQGDLDKMKTEVADATTAKQAAEAKVTSLEAELAQMKAAAAAPAPVAAPAAAHAAAPKKPAKPAAPAAPPPGVSASERAKK